MTMDSKLVELKLPLFHLQQNVEITEAILKIHLPIPPHRRAGTSSRDAT